MARPCRALVALLALASLAGCTPAPAVPVPTGSTASPTAAAVATADPGDLGLANVATDALRASRAAIGPDGGRIAATARDGTTYTLTLPAGALPAATEVAIYPVTSLAGMPRGTSLLAGVQFEPEGLQLRVAASLRIDLPAGTSTSSLAAIGWRGDGRQLHGQPIALDRQSATVSVYHFSGVGVTPEALTLALDCTSADDVYGCDADALLNEITPELQNPSRSTLTNELRVFYRDVVEPAFEASTRSLPFEPSDGDPDPNAELAAAYPYTLWLDLINAVRAALRDPSFTVSPEVGLSRRLAGTFLFDWYGSENAACVDRKDDINVRGAIFWAEAAIDSATLYGKAWHLATAAFGLDLQSLLDELCIRVLIDPSRAYTGSQPGDSGSIKVKVGISIAGGPLRPAPDPILVTAWLHRGGAPVSMVQTNAGELDVELPGILWPEGVDPMDIDLIAALADNVGGHIVPSQIQRYDRITKRARQLAFHFDQDLDTWQRGTSGPQGSSDWGTVHWVPRHGGSVELDGTGGRGRPNAWIFRTFDLPASATALRFDVSAHDRLDADTHLTVRIVAGGVSTVIRSEVVRHTGPEGDLSFATESLPISPWAGRTVIIFFEQDDNGIHGSFPGGDEQVYLDNIQIVTT